MGYPFKNFQKIKAFDKVSVETISNMLTKVGHEKHGKKSVKNTTLT